MRSQHPSYRRESGSLSGLAMAAEAERAALLDLHSAPQHQETSKEDQCQPTPNTIGNRIVADAAPI